MSNQSEKNNPIFENCSQEQFLLMKERQVFQETQILLS